MASTDILSYLGWYFLPNLVTNYLQQILYAVFIRAGEPKPAPGSVRHTLHRQRIHTFVIVAYLLYTIYEADYNLRRQGDFYSLLGVSHAATEKEVQSRFRRLTVQFHPDKTPGHSEHYLALTVAKDTLIAPAKRFAYDRFGPEILQWRNCSTIRDYVFTGLQQTAVGYAASAAFLALLRVLGYVREGMFWRWVAICSMLLTEVSLMTRSEWPWVLTAMLNPGLERLRASGLAMHAALLPFQVIVLLRKMVITFFIALSQLAPVLRGTSGATKTGNEVSEQLLNRLNSLTQSADQEVTRLMGLELSPFAGERSGMRDLRSGLKEWLVQNTIRNDSEVRSAIQSVLQRRRTGDG